MRRQWITFTVVALVILGAAAAAFACMTEEPPRDITSHPADIGGSISIDEARTRLGANMPSFGSKPVKPACGGDAAPVILIRANAGGNEVALAFTHGVTVHVDTSAPPLRQPNGPSGRQLQKTRRAAVRGFPANISARGLASAYFFCPTKFSCDDFIADPDGSAYWRRSAALTWIERGMTITLHAPHADGELIELAKQLRFGA